MYLQQYILSFLWSSCPEQPHQYKSLIFRDTFQYLTLNSHSRILNISLIIRWLCVNFNTLIKKRYGFLTTLNYTSVPLLSSLYTCCSHVVRSNRWKEKNLHSHLKPAIQESLWRRLLLPDQLVHVFWDLFVRHLRIDLSARYGRVPHHLGDALYRDACAERQRPERMTSHVERQALPDATGFAHSA